MIASFIAVYLMMRIIFLRERKARSGAGGITR